MLRPIFIVVFVLNSALSLAETCTHDPALRDALREQLAQITTATMELTSWQKQGRKTEFTAGRLTWAGQDRMRIDVHEGRGKGATAVLKGDKVTGFRRGWLSFIKLSFHKRHKRVLSIRGADLSGAGFFDDLNYVVDQWDQVAIETTETGSCLLRYTGRKQLNEQVWLTLQPLTVNRHEITEADEVVERYTYTDVVLNPDVDPKWLKPELLGQE